MFYRDYSGADPLDRDVSGADWPCFIHALESAYSALGYCHHSTPFYDMAIGYILHTASQVDRAFIDANHVYLRLAC